MVQWEITNLCNHNCIHCYNYWNTINSEELVSKNSQHYQKTVEEIINNKVFHVVITGGEPLLVLDEAAPYIKQLSEHGIRLSLNSNLTLLTTRNARTLKEIGINSILVSLPSINPNINDQITGVAGSLKRILDGIALAIKLGFYISVNMVVSKLNLSTVYDTAKYLASIGVKNFSASRASDPSSKKDFSQYLLSIDEFRDLEKTLIDINNNLMINADSLCADPVCSYGDIQPLHTFRFCHAGKTTCAISCVGEIRPCNRSNQVCGSVYNNGLLSAWNSLDVYRSDLWIPKECSSCVLKYRCGGGCKVDAVNTYGTPLKPDPFCDVSYIPKAYPAEISKQLSGDTFRINSSFRFRKENFGGIIFISIFNWLAVDHDLYQLLLTIGDTLHLSDLCNCLSIETEEAMSIVNVLAKRKVLLEGR